MRVERRRRREEGEPPRDKVMSLSEQAVNPGRFDKLQITTRQCEFLFLKGTIWGVIGETFKDNQSQK